MATITSLTSLAKNSVTSAHYLLVAATNNNYKFLLQDLFPSLATLGNGQQVYVGITNKNVINFKGIASVNNLLTVATASNNITLQVNPANINLANCNNTTSAFLSAVSLTAAYVSGTLPVSKGGTGATTLTSNGLLLGNGTSAMTALGAATNGQIPIGSTGNAPTLATLTAGSGITITNGAGAITISAAFSTLATALNANGNNIYGFNWLSPDTSNRGMKFNGVGQTFIGSGTPTPFYSGDLNVSSNIYVNANATQTIGSILTASVAPQALTIKSANANASNKGGDLYFKAGNSIGNNAGGELELYAGNHDGNGTSGNISFWGYNAGASVFLAMVMKMSTKTIGIFNNSPNATVDIKQDSASGNMPVLELEQLDTDESFINFVGTSGAASANSISSSTASAAAKTGAIKVKINGVEAWIRLYATAE